MDLIDEVIGYTKANALAAKTADEQQTWGAYWRNLCEIKVQYTAKLSRVREDIATLSRTATAKAEETDRLRALLTEAGQKVIEAAAENERLKKFARWTVQEGAFEGVELGGDEIQAKAIELGIIQPTKYDPEKHGPSDVAEPGDEWFVFAGALRPSVAPTERDYRRDIDIAEDIVKRSRRSASEPAGAPSELEIEAHRDVVVEALKWALPYLEGFDHGSSGPSLKGAGLRDWEEKIETIRVLIGEPRQTKLKLGMHFLPPDPAQLALLRREPKK